MSQGVSFLTSSSRVGEPVPKRMMPSMEPSLETGQDSTSAPLDIHLPAAITISDDPLPLPLPPLPPPEVGDEEGTISNGKDPSTSLKVEAELHSFVNEEVPVDRDSSVLSRHLVEEEPVAADVENQSISNRDENENVLDQGRIFDHVLNPPEEMQQEEEPVMDDFVESIERMKMKEALPSDEEIREMMKILPEDFEAAKLKGYRSVFNKGRSGDFQRYSLFTPIGYLKDLGIGILLYLRFQLLLAALFLLLGLLAAPSLVYYYNQTTLPRTPDRFEYRSSFGTIGRASVRCKENNIVPTESDCHQPPVWISILECFITLMYACFIIYVYRRQSATAERIDILTNTTTDYAVRFRGVPRNIVDPLELLKGCEKYGPVEQIVLNWDAGDLADEVLRRESLYKKYVKKRGKEIKKLDSGNEIEASKCPGWCLKLGIGRSSQWFLDRFQVSKEKFDDLHFRGGFRTTGDAFVVFSYEKDCNDLKVDGNPPLVTRLVNFIACRPSEVSKRFGFSAKVQSSPEPSDIFWSNLRYGSCNRFFRRIFLSILSMILMGACGGLLYLLERERREITAVSGQNNQTETSSLASFLSICIAIFVTMINKLLQISLFGFSRLEKHHTRTNMSRSACIKLALAQFINSSCILLIVADFFSRSEDVKDFYIFTSDTVVSIVGSGIVVTLILQLILSVTSKISAAFSRIFATTKAELLEGSIGPEFNLAERNAYVLKVVYVIMFFGTAFPAIYFFGAIAMLVSFMIDKMNLLKTFRFPPKYNEDLAKTTTRALSFGLVFHNLYAWLNGWIYAQFPFGSRYLFIQFILLLISGGVTVAMYFPNFQCNVFRSKFERGDYDTQGAAFDRDDVQNMPIFDPPKTGLKSEYIRGGPKLPDINRNAVFTATHREKSTFVANL